MTYVIAIFDLVLLEVRQKVDKDIYDIFWDVIEGKKSQIELQHKHMKDQSNISRNAQKVSFLFLELWEKYSDISREVKPINERNVTNEDNQSA